MKTNIPFYLSFSEDRLNKGNKITTFDGTILKVLDAPHKRWYKLFFVWISFGLYTIPILPMYTYKVIIINK